MLVAGGFAVSCGGDEKNPGKARAQLRDVVAVTSGPASMLAATCLPEANVQVVIPSGAHPTKWRPDDDAIDSLVTAAHFLTLGDAEFEPWMQRTALPTSRTVDLHGLLNGALNGDDGVITVGTLTHTHGSGESHSHGGEVATVWSDPTMLVTLAEGLAGRSKSLGFKASRLHDTFRSRVAAFEAALTELREANAANPHALIISDHGLEYVARAADLELRVALLECDETGPTNSRGIHQLNSFARRSDDAGLLICLDKADVERAAQVAAEVDVQPCAFDLGSTYDPDRDTLERLTESVRNLTQRLRNQ